MAAAATARHYAGAATLVGVRPTTLTPRIRKLGIERPV